MCKRKRPFRCGWNGLARVGAGFYGGETMLVRSVVRRGIFMAPLLHLDADCGYGSSTVEPVVRRLSSSVCAFPTSDSGERWLMLVLTLPDTNTSNSSADIAS